MAARRYVTGGSGGRAGFPRTTLISLDDVFLTDPKLQDILVFNGTKWVNHTPYWLPPAISIYDNSGGLPVAGFGWTCDSLPADSPSLPFTVQYTYKIQFVNNSLGGSLYHWDFGDTSVYDGAAPPLKSYNHSGTFIVTLTIDGAVVITHTLTVTNDTTTTES